MSTELVGGRERRGTRSSPCRSRCSMRPARASASGRCPRWPTHESLIPPHGPKGKALSRPQLVKRKAALVAAVIALLAGLFLVSPPLSRSASAAPPVISVVSISGVQNNRVTIGWLTDVASDTQIAYGTTAAYGSTTTVNTALVVSHSQAITGLAANQLYHFQLRSRNAA